MKMCWFPLILLLTSTISTLSEATAHTHKLRSALLVGTVYCDTGFQEDFSRQFHLISGASVAVECKDGSSRPSFRQEVKTNEHGEFEAHLPFSVSKHVKKIKRCSVKLISSSEPYCAVASKSAATSSSSSPLHLKSRKQGTHIFSAGVFTFKPLKQQQPNANKQKPSVEASKQLSLGFGLPNYPTFPPPLESTATPPPRPSPLLPNLPPLPQLPQLPPLPPLPPLPGLPIPPLPGKN